MRLPRLARSALAVMLAAALPVPLALAATAPTPPSKHQVVDSKLSSRGSSHSRTPPSKQSAPAKPTLLLHVSSHRAATTTTTTTSTTTTAAKTPAIRAASKAGDPGETISDFKFTPGTITVHVGDSITWTNQGPSPHTATASNGSFDTGTLQKGQSASHTFTQAGTFAYICKIHPFMHGTVVVLANAGSKGGGGSGSGGGSSSGSGSPTTTTPTTPTTASGPSLPNTGLDVLGALGAALLLLAIGGLLRRAGSATRS